jgi:hypothetical protein
MERNTADRVAPAESEQVIYCVVPPRLARIKPRLCEHFAGDSRVEVVIDQRVAQRRERPAAEADALADRLTPGIERRGRDGRRGTLPIAERAPLPPELRRYEQDLTFLASPVWTSFPVPDAEDTGDAGATAEEQALELARALIAATEALRVHGGMSVKRFREVSRAELAIERYRRWCGSSERAPF